MPLLLSSFLMLLLNLFILGVIYWGLNAIIGVIPFGDPIKTVLIVIVKVVCVILAVVWIADWVMAAISSGSGFGAPMFFPWGTHRS